MKVKAEVKEVNIKPKVKPLKVKWTQQAETDVNFDILIEVLRDKIKNKEKITVMEYSKLIELIMNEKMDNFYYNNIK
jgi:hypothetical protein